MIDKKKMEEAAKAYEKKVNAECKKLNDKLSYGKNEFSFTYKSPDACFADGANWAIKEFLQPLWHDAMEEPNPNLNAWIIMQSGADSWEIVKYGGYNKDGGQTWQREAEKGHVLRWCYLPDILPQEKKGGSDV